MRYASIRGRDASPEALRARLEVSQSLNTMLATFMEATSAIQAVDKELQRLRDAVKAAGDGHEDASKSLDALAKKLDPIRSNSVSVSKAESSGSSICWGSCKRRLPRPLKRRSARAIT